MEDVLDSDVVLSAAESEEKPKIYSKLAIRGFAFFFSPIFGGVLLMQNIKDVNKRKAANQVLFFSLLYTIATSILLSYPVDLPHSATFASNILGGYILTEYFFKKHLEAESEYPKKKIWKPLIISLLITIPLVLLAILAAFSV